VLARSLSCLVLVFVAGCGGKVVALGSTSESQPSAGSEGSRGEPDSGGPVTTICLGDCSDAATTANVCVDIDLSTYDQSCDTASDCLPVAAGLLCTGECTGTCPNAVISKSEGARYDAATTFIANQTPQIACACPAEGFPQCVNHQCRSCDPNGAGISDCSDLDAQPPPDSAPPDAGQCVDIELSTYDQSCQESSDCVAIYSGTVCTSAGSCLCPDSAINQSGQARYDAVINSLTFTGPPCACPFFGSPTCASGTCVMCVPGSGTAGCPDAAASP
jgi:hypothetical protein